MFVCEGQVRGIVTRKNACARVCTRDYLCRWHGHPHFQVGKEFASLVKYDSQLLWRLTQGSSLTVRKKSVWPYGHSRKKRFLDFPRLHFHLPSLRKPWSFPIMPSPGLMPWNHFSMIQFRCREYSRHQLPFPIPTESSRLWKYVCVIEPLQSSFMTPCYRGVSFQFSVFVFFNSTHHTWLIFVCL